MDQVVDAAYFEEIDRRFDQLCQHFEEELRVIEAGVEREEYIPEGRINNPETYKATPLTELKHIGPKRITIEEYRKRQQKKNLQEPVPTPTIKRKRRAGRKVKLRQKRKELHRLISISTGEQQKTLFNKLRQLK